MVPDVRSGVLLTDQEAIDECGPDVPNGYCIVNDNPKLRTLPVARTGGRALHPGRRVLRAEAGQLTRSLAEAVNETAQTDYDPDGPLLDHGARGQVVRISPTVPALMRADGPRDWDAVAYDRLPIPMTAWGAIVLGGSICAETSGSSTPGAARARSRRCCGTGSRGAR